MSLYKAKTAGIGVQLYRAHICAQRFAYSVIKLPWKMMQTVSRQEMHLQVRIVTEEANMAQYTCAANLGVKKETGFGWSGGMFVLTVLTFLLVNSCYVFS